MTISPTYAEQNRQLHASNEKYGAGGGEWGYYIERLIAEECHRTVCDYGAGKGRLASFLAEFGIDVAEYDPGVPGKERRPDPADLVVCTDVLEHVEPELLEEVLRDLARLTQRKLFLDICTAPAVKWLPDGRNAHLIVEPPTWWRQQLERHFDVIHWVERPDLNMVYGEAVPKGMGTAEAEARSKRAKRRKLSPELSAMCGRLYALSKRCHDELSRIRTIRMYEGDGDELADMQIVWDVLDDLSEPVPALRRIAQLARKGAMFRVALTEQRSEEWWRALIETHWHIVDWVADGKSLGIVVCPKLGVAGVNVIGAVDREQRWRQIEAAMARISKRIEPRPAHDRRGIVACYGPSLRDTIASLKAELAEAEADVASVSGAHDFLLAHGVVPTYHVECDPRNHKADNIAAGHQAVKYLLASVVHPALLDKLQGCDIALWHVADSEHAPKLLMAGESGQHIITGGGSVGLRAIPLLYAMGYRDFSVYGMDCSFADDRAQWAGPHAGKPHDTIDFVMAGRRFLTSPVLITYATDFIAVMQKMPDAVFRLYGDGLLQSMCRIMYAK
ncbi:MAG TPA: 6-hydroxymethylpterin diphosphokinase MptE-like protein [Xanthobacteraceae bacterium]|nr:6-hydroxymethylpterin diphosphokinase MptE-like protein [Xanthobacteraceae bacterium]